MMPVSQKLLQSSQLVVVLPADIILPPTLGTARTQTADEIMQLARQQIEYYFSPANLERDTFMKVKMDSGGWINLDLIASFARLKAITQDKDLLLQAVLSSGRLELSRDGSCMIRAASQNSTLQ